MFVRFNSKLQSLFYLAILVSVFVSILFTAGCAKKSLDAEVSNSESDMANSIEPSSESSPVAIGSPNPVPSSGTVPSPTGIQCSNATVKVVYTGADQSVAVPEGCTSMSLKVWGAGGGFGDGGGSGGGGRLYQRDSCS